MGIVDTRICYNDENTQNKKQSRGTTQENATTIKTPKIRGYRHAKKNKNKTILVHAADTFALEGWNEYAHGVRETENRQNFMRIFRFAERTTCIL